jgi:hypothetical protein
LYRGGAGRSFVARVGRCPVSKRRVHWCLAPADSPGPRRGPERICTLSVDAPKVTTGPTATRCRIELIRAENLSGRVGYRLFMDFPERPFRANGLRGELTVNIPSQLHEGVFAFGDPERPTSEVVGNMGGESIPIVVGQVRLQIDELSRESTIWTDGIHGTLDVDQHGAPFDRRRVVLHLEF